MNLATCKTLLMADGEVGYRIAKHLTRYYLDDIAAIITTDKNKISNVASSCGINTTTFLGEDELLEWLGADEFDLGLLAWWPHLVSGNLLSRARRGFLNTHPSFLPYNRGKHYNFWAIVEEAPFGVSLHGVTPGIDDGPIIAQSSIPYGWTDTGGTLYEKAQVEMVGLVCRSWEAVRAGQLPAIEQERNVGSFHLASELEPASKLDLNETTTIRALLNLLRARTFPGHPACSFQDGDEAFEVRIEITRK